MVVELWLYPDGTRIRELSTKCATSETFQVAAESRAFLAERGIEIGGAQTTKTRKALEFFSKQLHSACEGITVRGPLRGVRVHEWCVHPAVPPARRHDNAPGPLARSLSRVKSRSVATEPSAGAVSGVDPRLRARESSARPTGYEEPGPGWLVFAGIMVVIVGVLNVIYGVAAIGDSKFFVNDQKYIFSNLITWGWVTLILGVLHILAAFSISGATASSAAGSASSRPD
jgi:hypothetical protein